MKRIQKKVRSIFCLDSIREEEELQKIVPGVPATSGLGASIPPELFFNILRWAGRNDTRRETYERLQDEARRNTKKSFEALVHQENLEMAKAGPMFTLRNCSLVCLYWANQCREYMFRGARFRVLSLQRAQDFRKYSTGGCKNLVPICTLIRSIEVEMWCRFTQRSFLDLVYLPQTRGKLDTLKILGPFTQEIPSVKLDNPHWSVTNLATPPPSVTAYPSVVITAIDFPSFRHIIKYFKYFDNAMTYYLDNLTWDGKTPSTPYHFFKPPARHRRSVVVQTSRCTDNLALCTAIALMYPDFRLRAMSSQDQVLALYLINIVGDFYRNAPQTADRRTALEYRLESLPEPEGPGQYYRISFVVLHVPRNYVGVALHFLAPDGSSQTSSIESGRTPPIRTQIIGVVISIESFADVNDYPNLISVDLPSLKTSIEQQHPLHAVIIAFGNYGLFELLATRYPTLLEQVEGMVHVFVCRHHRKHLVPEGPSADDLTQDWCQVDNSTKATGKRWRDWGDAFYDILHPPVSRSPSLSLNSDII